MVHTFEQHKNKLDELCRLCGNKSLTQVEKKKNRKKLLRADYTADILLVFNIFVQRDSESKHPKHLCYKCMKTFVNFKNKNGFETLTNAQTKAQQTEKLWTEWDLNVNEDECTVCVHFAHTSSGNRNKKKKTDN